VPGLGAAALQDHVLAQLAPQGGLRPLRVLLCELPEALEPHLPFETPWTPLDAVVAERYAGEVLQQFGVPDLQLGGCDAALCLPLSAAPLQLCVGKAWLLAASPAERQFGLLRAVAVARFDLVLLVRGSPERLGLVLSALRQVVDPSHTIAVVDAAEQARIARELSALISEGDRVRALNLFGEVKHHEEIAPRRLIAAAYDAGARVALCATGDVAAAFECLLRLRGRAPSAFSADERLELCRVDPALRGLLSFAISELHADVRRDAAAARATG
jgi:hypothetical protein